MSTYAFGDIHGCYDEFNSMLSEINYDYDEDTLVFVGDYIDRGRQSYEMIQWLLEHQNNNIITIRGNHEEEFISNIDILCSINDNFSLIDTCNKLHEANNYFDLYGTIRNLISEYNFSLSDLINWKNYFLKMPYVRQIHVNHMNYTIVHAGYTSSVQNMPYESREQFYLYARGEEVFTKSKVNHRRIIMGHTPTIIESEPFYNDGRVKIKYDRQRRNIFYNLDCGCVFRNKYENAHLACMRLEDFNLFYI